MKTPTKNAPGNRSKLTKYNHYNVYYPADIKHTYFMNSVMQCLYTIIQCQQVDNEISNPYEQSNEPNPQLIEVLIQKLVQ